MHGEHRPAALQIVEVGLRDGLQSLSAFIPTGEKIALLGLLYDSGIRRAEITSFVSASAVPQFADAAELVAAAYALNAFEPQVLVPSRRHAERALKAGARHLAFVLSASESHNQSNVRRTSAQSAAEFSEIAAMAPRETCFRINLATSFHCPHEGRISLRRIVELLDRIVPTAAAMEIALCDTTGMANPMQVAEVFTSLQGRFASVKRWAFHGHDTYGRGLANAFAAWRAGAEVIDAAIAGLGGCPFAPGATGNVATEDIVSAFTDAGLLAGIDLGKLLDAADRVVKLPGAQTGGRVRTAMQAARLRCDAP